MAVDSSQPAADEAPPPADPEDPSPGPEGEAVAPVLPDPPGEFSPPASEPIPPELPPVTEAVPEIPEVEQSSTVPSVLGEPLEDEWPAAPPPVEEPPAPEPPPAKIEQPAALEASVTVLPGVGERHAQTLARLDIETLGDMLYHFPRRYDDYTRIKPINRLWYGEEVTVIGTAESVASRNIHGRKLQIVEALVSDGTGSLRVTWFNQPWILKRIRKGTHVVLSGKIDQYLGRLTMSNPEWELLEKENLHTNRIVPVYRLTAKLTQRWLRRMMHKVVTYWAPRVRDPLPQQVRQGADLLNLPEALLQAHFPDSWPKLEAARHRLAFDEIFLLQIGVLRQKREWQNLTARSFVAEDHWFSGQIEGLPFSLTSAQGRVMQQVRQDLGSGRPMNCLLQGDVGSGKTVIAALTVAIIGQQGAQSAIMAPTSILAEQHFTSLRALLAREGGVLAPDEIRLMVGATPEAEKREIRSGLAEGRIKLIVGTHALIEDPVTFAALEFVVIDEQHRFGVQQRAALRTKGTNPHLLVMTATPIPRSLSLTIYGDLDLSVMDEMPPGRIPVQTHLLFPQERERAYTLVRKQIEAGRQAFIIYPLVEETDKTEAKAAVEEHRRLQDDVFRNLKLGLLHGRLKPDEKDAVMSRFRDREYNILVSTTVVEVGVDVPNATVMVIEGANRFGLAQLHQLRGRVGRGGEQSFCLLIPQEQDDMENERLAAMVETNDGFVLAERDLEQRGPGEFLGSRQAGFSELQMAMLTDVRLIEKAREQAQIVVEADPDLENPEHEYLLKALKLFGVRAREISVNEKTCVVPWDL